MNLQTHYPLEFASTSLSISIFSAARHMKQDIVNGFFIDDLLLSTRFCDQLILFVTDKNFILSI